MTTNEPLDTTKGNTYSRWGRIFWILFGIAYPILAFSINHFDRCYLYPEYDDKTWRAWVGIAYSSEVQLYFYPLILWAMIALVIELFTARMRFSPWVRTGLLGGVIVSASFVCLYIIHIHLAIIMIFAPFERPIGMLFLGIAGISPHLAFITFLTLFIKNRRVYRRSTGEVKKKSTFVPSTLFSLFGIASTTLAIIKIRELHAALPQNPPPDCYLATAAARGYPAIVRPTIVRLSDGKTIPLTSQLKTLKTAEIVLMTLLPSLHFPLRRLYDRIGPRLATISERWVSTTVYLLLIPVAFVCATTLRMLFSDARDVVATAYVPRGEETVKPPLTAPRGWSGGS